MSNPNFFTQLEYKDVVIGMGNFEELDIIEKIES